MPYSFDYSQEFSFMYTLDVDNLGETVIRGENDDGLTWYLVISTSLGMTTAVVFGPVVDNMQHVVHKNFSFAVQKLTFNEKKIMKIISMFLNAAKKITKASIVDIETAKKQLPDLEAFLYQLQEGDDY